MFNNPRIHKCSHIIFITGRRLDRKFSIFRDSGPVLLCRRNMLKREDFNSNLHRYKSLVSTTGNEGESEAKHSSKNLVAADSTDETSELKIPTPWGVLAGKIWNGHGEGLPILGLHGWHDNAGTFDRLVPLLNFNKFIALEFPGHGRSSHLPPGDVYSYHAFLVSVRIAVRHLQDTGPWNKFSIIGHSLGAGIGAVYASLYPSEVENLVLLDLPKVATRDPMKAEQLAKHIDAVLDHETKVLKRASPVLSYSQALERLIAGSRNALTEDSAKILMVRGTAQVSENGYRYTRDPRLHQLTVTKRYTHEDIFEMYKSLRCRTMFVKSKVWPYYEPQHIIDKALDLLKENCKEFRHITDDGNHCFHLNDPTAVARHINNFLHPTGELGTQTSKL